MRRSVVFVVFAFAACSLATDFNRTAAIEQTAALCGDGIDNDSDGLADCQDWKCAEQSSCCTIPVIVLTDDFDAPACDAGCGTTPCRASPELWQSWGTPVPQLCAGAFVPGKTEQCFDVGLLGLTPVPLRVGLALSAGVTGRPEPRGRLVVGLTLQDRVAGSLDPCAPIEPADLALSIAMVSADGGYRFIAGFGDNDVAASATFADSARHELSIRIVEDRRVEYRVDGVLFAKTLANETVPSLERQVRVVVMGRGWTAGVDDVELSIGARCEGPAAWAVAPNFLDFEVTPAADSWDSFSVYGPAVVAGSPDEPARLYFGGCREAFGACNPVVAGYGRATLDVDTDAFVRDRTCPLVSTAGLVCSDGIVPPFEDVYNNVLDIDVARGAQDDVAALSQVRGGNAIALAVDDGGGLELSSLAIETGAPGSWDAAEVCCPAIVAEPDGTRRIWYTGRSEPGGTPAIGVADWAGNSVVKYADNPILSRGAVGESDDHGVSHPDVVWDPVRRLYRMWYVADGPLGLTSIAYAVSTDGQRWHRAPQNPVLTSESVGLRTIGAPSVISLDGALQMWIEGVAADRNGSQIYRVTNDGVDPAGR